MSNIRVLSEVVANRIAAGEVIERPSSVVKELLENSIDAGSTNIVIEVERGGIGRIRVVDNGSGMDADDALLCFETHGTSKIRTESDLESLGTLGFRGEAIPSIASVSHFTLRTRRADQMEGTLICFDSGKMLRCDPCGCAVGTDITVENLFANVPARRKFLRSTPTEEHHIEEIAVNIALCHTEISIELKIDGKSRFRSAGAPTLDLRLREFFGKNYAAQMWKLEHRENDMRLHGFVAMPGFVRTGRQDQRTFVNNRVVEAPAFYRGIKEGYGVLSLERGKFPPVILFLEMPANELDVNVHPAKREVRFHHDYAVGRMISNAISRTLRNGSSLKSSAGAEEENIEPKNSGFSGFESLSGKISLDDAIKSAAIDYPKHRQAEFEYSSEMELTQDNLAQELVDRNSPEAQSTATPVMREVRISNHTFDGEWPEEVLGILDATYILCRGARGLVMVDQHAAHERILFERLLKKARAGNTISQPLLLPEVIELPVSFVALLGKNREIFRQIGFEVELIGGQSVMVNALPHDFKRTDISGLFSDMLAELVENSVKRIPVELEFVARSACKAAIKAHDQLTNELAFALLNELRQCEQGTLCPHGRPTMITISRNEIIRRFER